MPKREIRRYSIRRHGGNIDKKFTEEVRRRRNREDFYLEVSQLLNDLNRKSKSMFPKITRTEDEETTTRITHQIDAADIAVDIAQTVGEDPVLQRLIMAHHDLEHSFQGHSGCWWISNNLRNYGLGSIDHAAQGARNPLNVENIVEQAIENLRIKNPNISEEELVELEENAWIIFDGILCHNGEGTDYSWEPDENKTKEQFMEQLYNSYVMGSSFSKSLTPKTVAGCIAKLADRLSYFGQDMVDALREKFIDGLDEEYIQILTETGIDREELMELIQREDYKKIASKVRVLAIANAKENSTKEHIGLSLEFAKVIYPLRDKNNTSAVNYATRETEKRVYPFAIHSLLEKYSDFLISEGLMENFGEISNDETFLQRMKDKYKDSPEYFKFIKFISTMNKKEDAFLEEVSERAIKKSSEEELLEAIEHVKNNSEPKGDSIVESDRLGRIFMYMNIVKGIDVQGNLSQEQIQKIMEEVQEEQELYGYASKKSRKVVLASANFLARLGDKEFIREIVNNGLISEEELKDLYRTYAQIGTDLKGNHEIDPNWKQVQQEQQAAAEALQQGDEKGI